VSRLLEADDIGRALRRLAHELVEANHGASELVLMGIQTRGVPLAERIAAHLSDIEGVDVPVGALDVTLYRDDIGRTAQGTPDAGVRPLSETRFPADIDDRIVVLVDDVLFTGRTIRAALDAVLSVGRPRAIRLVTLVDRGHRQLPIRADHVGKNLPTSMAQHIAVKVREIDGEDAVLIDDVAEGSTHAGGAWTGSGGSTTADAPNTGGGR
jgi:pyrimidine operon attenuation protein/uracil phosphoribosyltransferase